MAIVRTLIADDHTTLREVLRDVLSGYQDIEIVGEASNGEEAIDQVQRLQPDLVILDIRMPVLNGLRAAQVIKKIRPQTEIVIFAMRVDKFFVEAVRDLGVDGFVFKEEGTITLRKAVDAVCEQQKYFPSLISPSIAAKYDGA